MVPTLPSRGPGGLFKSPFPTDAAPPSGQSPDPRAVASVGEGGGGNGGAGDPRSQRPDLQVDWSHLERERAAIAANKARREGDARGPANRYAGPLIGTNELGHGQRGERDRHDDDRHERDDRHDDRHERDQRDERDERDDHSARDRHAEREDDADAYNGYGRDGHDGRRSRGHGYDDERDRAGNERGESHRRREHGARADYAPARHDDDGYDDGYDDRQDDRYDPRDAGDGGYDERYHDRHQREHVDRHERRANGQDRSRADRHARRDAVRDEYDEPWNAPGPAMLAPDASGATGEPYWETGGGLWGDAPAQGDSAYYPAPAAAGKSPGKAGKKSTFRRVRWIGSILSLMVAAFLLVRFEVQRSAAGGGTPTLGVNNAQSFTDSLLSNKNGWLTNTDCVFKADGYHLTRGYLAYAPVSDALNFDMWVKVKQTTGTMLAPYGLVFRRVSLGNYYVFGIDGNGKWTFYKAVDDVGTDIVSYTASPAIKQGLNAQNTLEVKAHGTHFTFFVNGAQVGQADDATFATKGSLGVAGHDDIEVIFTSFNITRLA